MRNSIWAVFALLLVTSSFYSCSRSNYLSVGFYNVENLFDTIDDPKTFDGEYLPDSSRGWDTDKYQTKLNNLAAVITSLDGDKAPSFLGLCEIENKTVVEDLVATEKLKDYNYSVVHIESKDVRGIDVAAVYNPKLLKLIDYGIKAVDLSAWEEITRDILWVKMESKADKEVFYFVVNHWPSRRGGLAESQPKRLQAAKTLRLLKDSLLNADAEANIVVMGDFNDEPNNASMDTELGATADASTISNSQLFNAMGSLKAQGLGSYCFRGNWNMLDQMLMNQNLLDDEGWRYRSGSAQVFGPDWLRQGPGKYEGYPLRSFGGRKYLKGYSDHFAVSIILETSTP